MDLEVTTHSGLDSMQRPIRPGLYCVQSQGDRTVCLVSEDVDTGELMICIHSRGYRISDLDPGCVLVRMTNLKRAPSKGDTIFIDRLLHSAANHRRGLAQVETLLSEHLGCVRGDGSPVWDGISAAVRDGLGTAVDLLDLAGD